MPPTYDESRSPSPTGVTHYAVDPAGLLCGATWPVSQRLVHRLWVELGLGAKTRTMLRVARKHVAAVGLEQSTTPGLDDAKARRYEDAGGLETSSLS